MPHSSLPVDIHDKRKVKHPGYSTFFAGIIVPAVLGSVMLTKGHCTDSTDSTGNIFCAEPPFSTDIQAGIANYAGSSLLFEAGSNFIKYCLQYKHYYISLSLPAEYAPLLSVNNSADQLPHPEPEASLLYLSAKLFLPYWIGLVSNLLFTFASICPILEKHAYVLQATHEQSHLIDKTLSVNKLHELNALLNKIFSVFLYVNAFVQTSGLIYPVKLVTVMVLVMYVFFREFVSIESARLIRQQLALQNKFADLEKFFSMPEAAFTQAVMTDFQRTTHANIKANCIPFNSDTHFLTRTKVQTIFDQIQIAWPEFRAGYSAYLGSNLNKIIDVTGAGTEEGVQLLSATQLFKNTLPEANNTVQESNAAGMALIIANLFIPPLIGIYAPDTGLLLGNILMSLATFMPLNGLTDWENALWGLHEKIRGQAGESESTLVSFLAFFIVNLPKLQAASGAVEGVGLSIGNTQIPLICESINMALAVIRSAITLSVTVKKAISPSEEEDTGDSRLRTLLNIM